MTRIAIVLFSTGFLFACEGEPKRVWKPSDHAHPSQSTQDPSRVPAGQGGQGSRRAAPSSSEGNSEARAAAALWRMSCSGCHGRQGRGGGPQRPAGAQMADLTQPGWQDSVTDSEIAQVIRNGRGQMPGFGDKLRPAAVDALVRHVRGFGPDRGGGDGTSDAGNTKQGAPDGGPGE